MFGVTISTRKPRTADYVELDPKEAINTTIADLTIDIVNNRANTVYLKWRI